MTPSINRSITLATWMIEHLTPRPHGEVLAGDLLEELHAGRTPLWYWRQVITAVALNSFRQSSNYTVPIAFSVAWSLFFPAWQISLWTSPLAQSLFNRWATLDWPFSGIAELSRGILPAATFIWFGLLFYLLLRRYRIVWPSILRLLGSFSLSLNVFLITAIGLRGWVAPMRVPLEPEVLYQPHFHSFIYAPLALSLLFAILTALPPSQQHRKAVSI